MHTNDAKRSLDKQHHYTAQIALSEIRLTFKRVSWEVRGSPRGVLVAAKRGSGDEPEKGSSSGVAVAPAKPALARPPMFKVILMNDDYTPMEFVVHVLERFFAMNREKATQIMLVVHTKGSAVVGTFPRDIAESKSEQVNRYAKDNNHPLLSKVEKTD